MGRAFEYRRAAKEKRWDKMSKLFPKLAKAITVAAKLGGPDPEMNAGLRAAILNAKSNNMPKDNIEAAIKRAAGKDASEISEINYEGKGPHGVLLIIECATDNPNRTVANIRSYFNKVGGQLLPTGSLEFMFHRKAVFEVDRAAVADLDELQMSLIDAGLQDVQENEGTVYVYGEFGDFGSLSHALEAQKIEVSKAGLVRIPESPQEFSDAEIKDIEKLLDRIEDDEDVQAVYTNIA